MYQYLVHVPVLSACTTRSNIKKLCILLHSVFEFSIRISEQTPIISVPRGTAVNRRYDPYVSSSINQVILSSRRLLSASFQGSIRAGTCSSPKDGNSVFAYLCHSTSAPYSFSSTSCSYEKENMAKFGDLPKKGIFGQKPLSLASSPARSVKIIFLASNGLYVGPDKEKE